MSSTVNLTGSSYVSDVPAVYYSTTSSVVEKFVNKSTGQIIAKTTLPGGTVISSTINLVKDPDNPGKVIASTVAASGITYVVSAAYGSAAIAATEVLIGSIAVSLGVIASPVVISLAAIGVVAIGTIYAGNQLQGFIYNILKNGEDTFTLYSPEVTGYATKSQFILQSVANDPNFCKRMFPEYIGYRQIVQIKSGTESFLYNTLMKKAEVKTAKPTESTELIFQKTDATKITVNEKTFDIRDLSVLALRNAVAHIDDVSFLLSKILFHAGEKFDVGAYGTYVATSSDYAVSLIAEKFHMTTKELVMRNTWLIDDKRIKFNYPTKVLLDEGTKVDNATINHRLIGDNVADVLIDLNGGVDTLVGYGGDDYLNGGAGGDTLIGGLDYDTYISGDGDTIDDSDGKGEVNFEGFKLTGGTLTGTYEIFKTYEGDGGMYILRSDGTLIFSKNGNFLTINHYHKENNDLGIKLTGDDLELSIFAPVVSESAGVATGAMTLSHAYGEDVIVTLYTQDDTAIAGSDYVGRPTFDVRIPSGETYVIFDISILDNQEAEPTETFYTLVDTVRTTHGAHVDFTLIDVQPFTIEDDDNGGGDNPDDPNNPTDPKYVTVSVSNGQNVESGGTISFIVSLSDVLSKNVSIDFITQDGTANTGDDYIQYGRYGVTIPAGQQSAVYQVVLLNNEVPEDTENFSLTPYFLSYTGPENVLLSNGATGTIIDDDGAPGTGGEDDPEDGHPLPYNPETPQPHDPLVLDLNQDGKISTIALENSQVYFDLTGDGVKERVGWIAPEDGLLVYDKNMNGKIDGVSEVFGKDGLSGFAELRAVADTNYDNVIDRRDALFSQLKVWQDTNSDGISQATELKSLSSAGVKNIELNVIGTNINLNGNLLSEAGRYGDTAGERELAADIQLLATQRVSSSNTPSTYTIDPITETLPQMRGYGYIDNSFKSYNLDPKLKELALSFMNDKESASANFGEFILRWSGFYDMADSKGISEASLSPYLADHSPIKLWILERFVGSKKEAWRTEAHLGENTNGGYHNQSFGNESYITDNFNLLLERYEAMFALQAYYNDVFSDTHYDYVNSFDFINQKPKRKAA